MASAENEKRLRRPVALRVLVIHLASWRYLAALTLPPLLFVAVSPTGPGSLALLAMALWVHYCCWRLWLDERLFRVLPEGSDDIAAFDVALRVLWGAKAGDTPRTLMQRWAGARRLLYRALAATLGLWGLWILVLWWSLV